MSVAFKIALRELRGGLAGFRIFLLCLALGVAAIAAVGSVRMAIQTGLSSEANAILGGDASMEFTYRFASDEELAWMDEVADQVSNIVDFRSLISIERNGERERALVQVKGIDDAYPLYGNVGLNGDQTLSESLTPSNGIPGFVAAKPLVDRLELEVGDILRLGTKDFLFQGTLLKEPDNGSAGFSFGPRVIVEMKALEGSGLITAGTLFNTQYRLKVPLGTDIAELATVAKDRFSSSGMKWTDSSDSTPALSQFVERMGSFLVIVGLAGLIVGGVGVSAAVSAYLNSKTQTIAILKTLGASSRIIFSVYLIQIGALALIGVGFGLILGVGAPLLLGPIFAEQLPVPAIWAIYSRPIYEAATYGVLTALIFTLWPLARAVDIRVAGLFRDEIDEVRKWPRWYYWIATMILIAALVGLSAWFSGVPKLALSAAFGLLVAMLSLLMAAYATKFIAGRLSKSKLARGKPAIRSALAAVSGPGGEATSVILSLGLGLSILATVGQIDKNMQSAISEELPAVAPAYFFVDILNEQKADFEELVLADKGVSKIDSAPMMRGIITGVNGQPAKEVFGDHWTLRGDRGITYAAEKPARSTITEGEWWPSDYTGPPLMSFTAADGADLGLKIGDEITINILGRDVTAAITNFRNVEWTGMGINFLMILNPAAVQAAPHSHIATVYADEEAEGRLLRTMADAFPNITAIRVRDAIEQVTTALMGIASATRWAAAATLLTGFVVLIGAAAAGERRRVYEAAILKTLGATRSRILVSFAIRAAVFGAAAGLVAILFGGIAGWAVMTFVMEIDFKFATLSGVSIVTGGAIASLVAGMAFALRPLASRPAQVLRARE